MHDGALAQLDPDLAIVRGPPLADEVGLGPLTLPGLLDEVTARCASREALVFHRPNGAVDRWAYRDLADRQDRRRQRVSGRGGLGLAACPGVKLCKTTGVLHVTLGEMVVSLIVPESGREFVEEDALRYLKQRLASYKVPRRILLIGEADLNLTGTAKIKPADARALALRKMAALDQATPS